MSSDSYLLMSLSSDMVERSLANLAGLLSSQGLSAWLSFTMGPYLAKRAKERFISEGDDVTGPWAPLSPATVAWRESEGFPGEHPINVQTGQLEEWVVQGGWFAYPTGMGATMRFPKNRPTGELAKKVKGAQLGDEKNRQPARPVLGVNERDMLYFQTALSLTVDQTISSGRSLFKP